MTPKIGTLIHVALPWIYKAHAGVCRPALVCEVLSDVHVAAHVFVAPSDLAGLPDTDAKTRVPYFQGFRDDRRMPGSWHYPGDCSDQKEGEDDGQ